MSDEPPVARTVSSGRIVRFRWVRGLAIDAVWCQVGVGWVMSRTYVFGDEGAFPPLSGGAERYDAPAFMILPGRYITPLAASRTWGSTTVHCWVATFRAYVAMGDSSEPAARTRPSGRTNTNG